MILDPWITPHGRTRPPILFSPSPAGPLHSLPFPKTAVHVFFFGRWQHIQSKSHKAALHRLAARNSLHIKKYARDYIPSNYSHITHCHQRHTQNLHGFCLASQDLNPSTTTPLPSPTLDFALRAGQAEGARVQA